MSALQQQRLAAFAADVAPTEAACLDVAAMRGARKVTFALGAELPPSAFSRPGGATRFLTITDSFVAAGHLADLSRWPRLVRLNVNGCDVDLPGLVALAAAPALTDLCLERTNVTDAGLASVAQVTRLRWLTLGQTAITDVGLAALRPLADLRVLWVNQTAVTDAGLMRLAELGRLTGINADRSGVTAAGKDALFAAQQAALRRARRNRPPYRPIWMRLSQWCSRSPPPCPSGSGIASSATGRSPKPGRRQKSVRCTTRWARPVARSWTGSAPSGHAPNRGRTPFNSAARRITAARCT